MFDIFGFIQSGPVQKILRFLTGLSCLTLEHTLPIGMSMCPPEPQCGGSGPAPPSFLNSSITSCSRGISRSGKELTADDHRMLRIPKWRPGLPLTLRCEDRLELFFERRGHGQAFDDKLCKVVPGIGFRVIRVFLLRRRTPDPSAFSGKPLPRRARDRAGRRSAWRRNTA
jgi:hypothetical protein